jgi:isopentenyldiphosphate isomerase
MKMCQLQRRARYKLRAETRWERLVNGHPFHTQTEAMAVGTMVATEEVARGDWSLESLGK